MEDKTELLGIKKKLDYNSLTDQDKVVVDRASSGWVIEPIIFETGRSTCTPILASIGFEMMSDSNYESATTGAFATNDAFSAHDKIHMMKELFNQQIDILVRVATNYIKESTISSFTNFYNLAIRQMINPDRYHMTGLAFWGLSTFCDDIKADYWISSQVRSYIFNYLEMNNKYDILPDIVNNIKNGNATRDDLPPGTWRDYTAQLAVNIAQYIGTLMVEDMFLTLGRLCANDTVYEDLKQRSVLINNVSPHNITIEYVINVYMSNYMYPGLYSLIADPINKSVYRALCNIIGTFPETLLDNTNPEKQ